MNRAVHSTPPSHDQPRPSNHERGKSCQNVAWSPYRLAVSTWISTQNDQLSFLWFISSSFSFLTPIISRNHMICGLSFLHMSIFLLNFANSRNQLAARFDLAVDIISCNCNLARFILLTSSSSSSSPAPFLPWASSLLDSAWPLSFLAIAI